MSRRKDDLEELVRRMRASGEFDRLLAEAPDVAAWAAWGPHVSGDWAGMLALTPPADATRRARVIRFIAGTVLGDDPPPGFDGDERGLRLIRAARVTSRHHGYRLADRAVFAVIEGRMLTRLGRLPEAVEALGGARAWCAGRGLHLFREWADTWYAIAHLGLGGDPDEAHALLASAAAGMERAGRRLELPAALVALAEASWRRGDEAGHDAAADAAHAAAVAMGTLGPPLTAVEALPDVLARGIDAAPADDPVWRGLAGAGWSAPRRTSLGDARLVVRTLGRAATEGEGRPLQGVSPKGVELAAVVTRGGPAGVPRAEVAEALFEGGIDSANYLRQLVHRLRRALPAGGRLS